MEVIFCLALRISLNLSYDGTQSGLRNLLGFLLQQVGKMINGEKINPNHGKGTISILK
jgi:hypothetical protein